MTYAVADLLGTKLAVFPSGHGGFLGGEYGQTGEPGAFAARLSEALQEAWGSGHVAIRSAPE